MSLNSFSVIIVTQIVVIIVFNPVFETKGIKFCEQKLFDTAFNDLKNRTLFLKNTWIWTYDQNNKNMSAPAQQDTTSPYRIKSMAYISDVPKCQDSDKCSDIQKSKGLVIMFYRPPKKTFAGAYQVKRVVEGVVTAIDDSNSLPLGLRIKGNVFSTQERFWPKIINEMSGRLDRKHTIIAYNPLKYELIVLSKGQYKGWLCIFQFTTYWKCQPVVNHWVFVGAFAFTQDMFVLAIKGTDNHLFTMSKDNEIYDTSLSIQSYLGCGRKGKGVKTFMADSVGEEGEPLKTTDNQLLIWVIVVIATVICLIVVFALIAVFTTKNKGSKEGKEDKPKHKLKVKPKVKPTSNSGVPKLRDDKGNVVNHSKVGVLDSKVNWDIVLSTPSMGSEERTPTKSVVPKTNPINKKSKTSKV